MRDLSFPDPAITTSLRVNIRVEVKAAGRVQTGEEIAGARVRQKRPAVLTPHLGLDQPGFFWRD